MPHTTYKTKACTIQADSMTKCLEELAAEVAKLAGPDYRIDHIIISQGLDGLYEATIYYFCELEQRPMANGNGHKKQASQA